MIDQKTLKFGAVLSFFISIVSLIVVDWYFHGYGLLFMFVFISLGLILEQLSRIYFPTTMVNNYVCYKKNKLLKLWALILFVMSPIALIYGNQIFNKLGFISFALLIGTGIFLDQIAQIRYPYSKEK
jgi:hypothetical protein